MFFKTGQMLMKMRNTDNKDANRTIELNQNFYHLTISEWEMVQRSHLGEASMMSINTNQLYFTHLRKN